MSDMLLIRPGDDPTGYAPLLLKALQQSRESYGDAVAQVAELQAENTMLRRYNDELTDTVERLQADRLPKPTEAEQMRVALTGSRLEFFSIGDAAKRLGCSPSWLRKLEAAARIPKPTRAGLAQDRYWTADQLEVIAEELRASRRRGRGRSPANLTEPQVDPSIAKLGRAGSTPPLDVDAALAWLADQERQGVGV